jgi:transposase
LYRLSEWCNRFEGRNVPNGLGSDDVFGRALDSLFVSDRALIQSELVTTLIGKFNVSTDRIHSDSTSVKFYGRYLKQKKRGKQITFGYSKDHPPDLKQLVYQLCVSSDGAVPLFHATYDGNQSDVSSHLEIWNNLRLVLNRSDFVYVADSKLCVNTTLAKIHDEGGLFITIVPKTRTEYRDFAERALQGQVRWEYLYKRKVSKSRNDRVSVAHGHHTLDEGYRVFWYHLTEKKLKDQLSRDKRLLRAESELRALAKKPGRGGSSGEILRKKASKILSSNRVEKLFQLEFRESEVSEFKAVTRGPRTEETKYRRVTKKRFHLYFSRNALAIAREAAMDGIFPLVTNSGYSATKTVQSYRWQPNLERRFSILKSNLTIAPVFLKNNTRVEALTSLYFYAEIVVALIERQLKSAMNQKGSESISILPEGRESKSPTWEQVRRTFYDLSIFELSSENGTKSRFFDKLSDLQKEVLELLGVNAEKFQ